MATGPIERINQAVPDNTIDALVALPPSDLTSLLMDVARRRAARVDPATVNDRYRSDRFAQPATIDLQARHEVEAALLGSLPPSFDTVVLSPVVPFGAHAIVASVHQHRVVTTTRNTEVAADPTVGLTLEAAARRRRMLAGSPKSPQRVRLASIQRITRGQRFDSPQSFAHFDVFALVTAGRDQGHHAFEVDSLVEHVEIHTKAVLTAGADSVTVSFSDFTDGHQDQVVDAAIERIQAGPTVVLRRDPDRQAGRGYYGSVVFNIVAQFGDTIIDIGDGGLVTWTQQLLASRKERLMTSGLGMDRVTLAMAETR